MYDTGLSLQITLPLREGGEDFRLKQGQWKNDANVLRLLNLYRFGTFHIWRATL